MSSRTSDILEVSVREGFGVRRTSQNTRALVGRDLWQTP